MPQFPFTRRVFRFLTMSVLFSVCAMLHAQNSSRPDARTHRSICQARLRPPRRMKAPNKTQQNLPMRSSPLKILSWSVKTARRPLKSA